MFDYGTILTSIINHKPKKRKKERKKKKGKQAYSKGWLIIIMILTSKEKVNVVNNNYECRFLNKLN